MTLWDGMGLWDEWLLVSVALIDSSGVWCNLALYMSGRCWNILTQPSCILLSGEHNDDENARNPKLEELIAPVEHPIKFPDLFYEQIMVMEDLLVSFLACPCCETDTPTY